MSVREIMSVIKNLSSEPDVKKLQKIEQEIKDSCSASSKKANPKSCGHWYARSRVCIICKSKVDKIEGREFNYLIQGLQLSHECVTLTKRFTTQLSSFKEKKLHLVLDLDHTLLHCTNVSRLTKVEKPLIKEVGSAGKEDLYLHDVGLARDYLTKLRPFVHNFLREANEMFTMYVYTMGNRVYAKDLLKLIDPEEVYFEDRVITGDDSPYVKTLDLVLGEERGIVIVDDTPSVWTHHKRNLVEISKYFYFNENGNKDSKPYSEDKGDESEEDGGLANVLKVLNEVHCGFFRVKKDQYLKSQDVRLLLEKVDIKLL